MKISKKKIACINRASFMDAVLKEYDDAGFEANQHWTDLPPDMWSKEQRHIYDMMNELEMKLKASIINILS